LCQGLQNDDDHTCTIGGYASSRARFVQNAFSQADDEVIDESGCDPRDIELVISQACCTRAAAVKALNDHNHDIVNAIMDLTM
jgi:NACalpha-BTF3-like transcription factor